MARPDPYVLCLDMRSSHAAIRALYAAGYQTKGYTLMGLIGLMNSDETCHAHPNVFFVKGDLGIYSRDSAALQGAALCNSSAHMIRYLKAKS